MTDTQGKASKPVADPMTATENMAQAYALAQEAWTYYLQTHADGSAANPDPYNLAPALADLQKAMIEKPEKMIEAGIDLWHRQATLWTNALAQAAGVEPKPMPGLDNAGPGNAAKDKRFADEEWDKNIVFSYLKQSYLLSSNWMRDTVINTDKSLPPEEQQKLEFFAERFSEAMSPSNVFAMNPQVLKTTAEEGGANIVRGMRQMLKDLKRGKGDLLISQTDMTAFEVGRNIAVTPGQVVFRNDLFELIQYTPTTETVHETPLLIAPPWINKFYIMDLNEKKSLVRWLVAQGYTVFMISWRNPEPAKGTGKKIERTFSDYVTEGLYPALDAVIAETGVKSVNVGGYCIGGTMLATALAHMAQTGDKRIKAATFFTAQADFVKGGDLRILIDDKILNDLEKESKKAGGVIDARHMAQAFNMLRGNELIWNYVVNNYYLGKEPSAFDLLYWNADSTHMPAKCHLAYLRDYYRDNALAEGKMTLDGKPLDLAKVKTPIYSICAREDHIAPAESVFRGVKLFGGPVQLVVGGSGHIAGVINPPDPNRVKYQYWKNTASKADWPETLAEWLEDATETPGSWWPDWDKWLTRKSGKKVDAREPGATLGVIEPAPGSYVRVRSDMPVGDAA